MIDCRESIIYHLTIGGGYSSFVDYFRLACYNSYRGKEAPIFWHCRHGNTSVIDLSQSAEDIFSGIKSNFRNEIRRAEKEGVTLAIEENVASFVKYYNEFAIQKGLSAITAKNVTKYPSKIITKALGPSGEVLTYHAYIIDEEDKRVYLLYSASKRLDESVDTKLIGYANKFLHFKDIEMFKEKGMAIYDFNGIGGDDFSKPATGIRLFKMSFGGTTEQTLNYNSPLMSLALYVRKILHK